MLRLLLFTLQFKGQNGLPPFIFQLKKRGLSPIIF